MNGFTGVKVFSATKAQDREVLGEKITAWIRSNPSVEVVDKVITQSSDQAFHCLAITLFYTENHVTKAEAANGNGRGTQEAAEGHRARTR